MNRWKRYGLSDGITMLLPNPWTRVALGPIIVSGPQGPQPPLATLTQPQVGQASNPSEQHQHRSR